MIKPFGDYNPPEGWIKFENLEPGKTFHEIIDGRPVEFIKLQIPVVTGLLGAKSYNAVNLGTGELVEFDSDEFIWPIDAGWLAEISCYGVDIPEEIKVQGHKRILAHVFNQCEARKANNRWTEEVAKYFPD